MKRALVVGTALLAAAVGGSPNARACTPMTHDNLVSRLTPVVIDSADTPLTIAITSNSPISFRRFYVRTGAMTEGNRWGVQARTGHGVQPVADAEVSLRPNTWSPVDLNHLVGTKDVRIELRPAIGTRGEFLVTEPQYEYGFQGPGEASSGALAITAVTRGVTRGDALVLLEVAGVNEYRAPPECAGLPAVAGNAYERPVTQSFVKLGPGETAAQHFATPARTGRFTIDAFAVYLRLGTATSVAWTVERAGGVGAVSGTFTPVNGKNTVPVPGAFRSADSIDEANDFVFRLRPLDGTLEWALRASLASGPCDPAARATIGGSLSLAEVGGRTLPEADFALGTQAYFSPGSRPGYFDADGDGYGTVWPDPLIPKAYVERLADRSGDCDDADPERFPGNPEVCDGKPNNCNGPAYGDGALTTPPRCPLTLGVCAAASQPCVNGKLEACTKASYGPLYEPQEIQCDGLDNDCDGKVDEWALCQNQTGVCRGSVRECVGDARQVCGYETNGPDYQMVETRCDGLDNDCDGEVDEGCPPPVVEDSPVCGCSSAGPGSFAVALLALAALRRRRA